MPLGRRTLIFGIMAFCILMVGALLLGFEFMQYQEDGRLFAELVMPENMAGVWEIDRIRKRKGWPDIIIEAKDRIVLKDDNTCEIYFEKFPYVMDGFYESTEYWEGLASKLDEIKSPITGTWSIWTYEGDGNKRLDFNLKVLGKPYSVGYVLGFHLKRKCVMINVGWVDLFHDGNSLPIRFYKVSE